MQYIGVLGTAFSDTVLKRAALLCDVVICGTAIGRAAEAIRLGIVQDELSIWTQKALTTLPPLHQGEELARARAQGTVVYNEVRKIVGMYKGFAKFLQRPDADERLAQLPESKLTSMVETLERVGEGMGDLFTRMHTEVLRRAHVDDTIIPVLYGSPFRAMPPDSPKGEIIRVILQQLPLPTSRTPWEAIAEWRQDSEAQEKYRALRKWIAQSAREQRRPADVEEELPAMLDTYTRYMSIQHKKMKRTRFEAIILPIAAALEDIVHFKLSKAAASLFGLYKEEIGLLEAELAAPGREVAYIAASRQRFVGSAA